MEKVVKKDKKEILNFILQIVMVAIAGIVGGTAFKSFFDSMETKIVPTGMSGLSMLIEHWFGLINITLPTSIVYLVLNAIIFGFAFKYFGWRFMLLSGVGLGTYVLGMQFGQINAVVESVGGEPLVLCIVGSIIMGAATGLGIRFGGTTGGSDVFGKLLNRIAPRIKTGYCILIFNGIVLTLSVVTLGLSTGLYAVINSIVSSLATDFVLDNSKKIVSYFIICDKAEEVAKGIMKEYCVGVTKIDATGMFTGNHKSILLCLVPYDNTYKMKDYISKIDKDAFIFSTPATETIGEIEFSKTEINKMIEAAQLSINDIEVQENEEVEKDFTNSSKGDDFKE